MRVYMIRAILVAAIVLLRVSAQNITAENTSSFVGNGRWTWTIFLKVDPAVLSQIKCVEYTLHPTFPNPLQVVCDRGSNDQAFALNGSGWGEFEVKIKIILTNDRPISLKHWLKLTP